jgi:hypothetical protein
MRRLWLGAVTIAALATTGSAPAADVRTFDLSTGVVNGRAVLGRSPAGVTAALGRPDTRFPGPRYRLQYDRRGTIVYFRRQQGQLRAVSLVFRDSAYREARLGRALRLRPVALQRAIANAYGDEYALEQAYRCRQVCTGVFVASEGGRRITFGREPDGRTFIVFWRT